MGIKWEAVVETVHGKRKISYLDKIVDEVNKEFDTSVRIALKDDKLQDLQTFVNLYNEKFCNLKDRINKIHIDFGASTLDVTRGMSEWEQREKQKQQVLKDFGEQLKKLKLDVMEPTYMRLGPEVIEASQSARELVSLMNRRRVTSDEYHRIVGGLVRWHVIDELYEELQRRMQPLCFGPCFEVFATAKVGHPTEDLYELADKERLRHTLEALHREKYSTSVTHGWGTHEARTKHFLLAFMLSLYRHPLQALYGKMAAFHRFFTEVCGYGFVKAARTLQNWFRAYQDFMHRSQSTCPPKADARWESKVRKYDAVNALVRWMQMQLPKYGIALA